MDLRDKLLMELDDLVQYVYEETGKDYEELYPHLKRVVDALHSAQAAVREEL